MIEQVLRLTCSLHDSTRQAELFSALTAENAPQSASRPRPELTTFDRSCPCALQKTPSTPPPIRKHRSSSASLRIATDEKPNPAAMPYVSIRCPLVAQGSGVKACQRASKSQSLPATALPVSQHLREHEMLPLPSRRLRRPPANRLRSPSYGLRSRFHVLARQSSISRLQPSTRCPSHSPQGTF